jgi:hypothetical protein
VGVEFHLSVYDDDVAERRGEPAQVGFSFAGMTLRQAESAHEYVELFNKKLAAFIEREQLRPQPEVEHPTQEVQTDGPTEVRRQSGWQGSPGAWR